MSEEYDAFGRKKDEAGLGDLKWGTTGDPVPNSDPQAPAPTVTAAESGLSTSTEFRTAATTSSAPRVWRRRRNPFVWLVQLLVLGGVAWGIYLAVDAGNDAANSIRDTFDAVDDIGSGFGTGTGGGDQGDDTVPEQVQARKLFTAAGLRSALKALEKEVPGRVEIFALRRDRINATIIEGDQRAVVNFDADAEIPDVQARTSAAAAGDTLSYEQISPKAPFKLLEAANARVNRSDADVDYFVVQNFSGEVMWGVYYKGGSPIAQGDSRGRFIRAF